jgi:predicted SprT family Zn-dependent metalloprotease
MELKKAEEIVKKLFIEYGLYEDGWKFKWDNSTYRNALCDFIKKTIFLSKKLVILRKRKYVKNTILHEIAHAKVGYEHGHNEVWKKYAESIGCVVKVRESDNTHISPDIIYVPYNYKGICSCGNKIYRHRNRVPKICSKCKNISLKSWEKIKNGKNI